jgi:hypothetical protein
MPLEVMRRLAGDRASDTLRRRILHGGTGRLLDDGLRALGVRVTELVQRDACECSDACRCCQLPANRMYQDFLLFYFYVCVMFMIYAHNIFMTYVYIYRRRYRYMC